MTLAEYPREAVAVLEANGLTWTRIMKDILKNSCRRDFEALLNGQRDPTLMTLEKLEAASGVSLDEVDPRIHRGEALAERLAEAKREHHWSREGLAAAIGVTGPSVNAIMAFGRLGAFAKPCHAIRLCDILEGRMNVLSAAELRREQGMAPKPEDGFLALPPEAKGDPAYLRARRAFWKCVGSSPKLFRLRRAEGEERLFLADGPAIAYRFQIDGDRVRFTARMRRSGFVLTEREMVV